MVRHSLYPEHAGGLLDTPLRLGFNLNEGGCPAGDNYSEHLALGPPIRSYTIASPGSHYVTSPASSMASG